MLVFYLLSVFALFVVGGVVFGRLVMERPEREKRQLDRVRALLVECPPNASSFFFHGFPATLRTSWNDLTLTVDLRRLVPSSVRLSAERGDRVSIFDPSIDTELCVRGKKDEVYSIMNERVRAELRGFSVLWPHFPRLEEGHLVCGFSAHDVAQAPARLTAARRLVSALATLAEEGVPERLLSNYEHDQNFELGRASLRVLLEQHKGTPAAERAHALALARRDIAPVGDELGRLSLAADGDEMGRLALSKESGALGLSPPEDDDSDRS